MLFLHEEPATFVGLSPQEIEKVIAEYTAFRDSLKESGTFAGSAKLTDEGGKTLTGQNGNLRVTDGPYTEAKEVIGGYYGIKADNYEEAVKIASGCPHLKYGGRVEVREIEFQS